MMRKNKMCFKRCISIIVSTIILCSIAGNIVLANTSELDPYDLARNEGFEFWESLNLLEKSYKQGDVVVPSSFGDVEVIRIEDECFKSINGLTSVILPDTVKIIGDYAFANCYDLKAVYIPSSVESIGSSSFTGCSNVTVYCESGSYAEKYYSEHIEREGEYSISTEFDESAFYNPVEVIPTAPPQPSEYIEVGDYIEMGIYNGKKILWRCIGVDEFGPLMLADEILCRKEFDSKGKHSTDDFYENRTKYGSNRWSESNLRCWLNADCDAESINWICGNPPLTYREEDGFLTNFSDSEKAVIKTVSHKNVLEQTVDGVFTEGGKFRKYSTQYDTYGDVFLLENFDRLYYETTEDRMFLLDYKQYNELKKSGLKYWDKSDYIDDFARQEALTISDDEGKYGVTVAAPVALRTPTYSAADYHGQGAKLVIGGYANGYFGIRPAFYIDLKSDSFSSGNGSRLNPYTIAGGMTGGAKKTCFAVPTESKVLLDNEEIHLEAYNIDDSNYFKLRDIANVIYSKNSAKHTVRGDFGMSDYEMIAVYNRKKHFNVTYDIDENSITIITDGIYFPDGSECKESDGLTKQAVESEQVVFKVTDEEMKDYSTCNMIMYNIDGSNYCRLRDIAYHVGYKIEWDSESNTINIITDEENMYE